MNAIAHRGVATLGARSLTDRIYVGTLLYTKYISCVPHGFREEDILSFIIVHWIYWPGGMTRLDPVAWLVGFM